MPHVRQMLLVFPHRPLMVPISRSCGPPASTPTPRSLLCCCCFHSFLSLASPTHLPFSLSLRCSRQSQCHVPLSAQRLGGGGKGQEAKAPRLQVWLIKAMKEMRRLKDPTKPHLQVPKRQEGDGTGTHFPVPQCRRGFCLTSFH